MKDKMMEIIKTHKGLLCILFVVILNIGWMAYNRNLSKDGISITARDQDYQMNLQDHALEEQGRLLNESSQTQQEVASLNENGKPKVKIDYKNQQIIDEEAALTVSNTGISLIETPLNLENSKVPIYICGAVMKPGVYYVASDAIINDVVKLAGGLTRLADDSIINLASTIQPNEKIIIPTQGEEIDKSENSYENRERNGIFPNTEIENNSSLNTVSGMQNNIININTATKEQLMTLSGIGEVKAEAIIAYRQESGGFKSTDEMIQVSGIGKKTFEKIKQFITTD